MPEDTKYEELLATARKQFDNDVAEEQEIREEAAKNFRMEGGDQWDARIKAEREKNGRPCLTFNRMHTFVQQVANEARQNKVQIKYIPGEDGDKEEAEVYEGLARYIQSTPEAEEAYETAAENAAAGGFGPFGFITDYCDDKSFDQDVKVRSFPDPFQVYGLLIPACNNVEPDHAFVVTDMTKAEFERLYPKAQASSFDWGKEAVNSSGWLTEDKIRVAEYWVVQQEEHELVVGEKKRTVYKKSVKCYKINGFEVLEETEWAGTCIPIVMILGKRRFVDGKPKLYSVISFQRDPQRLINFYKTRIAETLGTAPIQPYMVAEGQITPELRKQWESLNTSMRPYLEYGTVNLAGQPVPAPQRQVFEPPIASLSAAAAQEIDDMKAAAGIFDPSLGAKAQATSGIAKLRDQQQASITNMHFPDNVSRGLKKGGAILREVLPKYYDGPRAVQIMGGDDTPSIVQINQQTTGKDGQPRTYQIGGDGAARYNVLVDVGRAFSTKRVESFDMMGQVIQANPQILPMVGDIMFKNSDLAGSDQLAERFKKMLPPELQDKQEGQPEIPPQVQQQMQQMQQQSQALNAYAQQVEQELQSYKAGAQVKQMEIESRERIEKMKMELQLTIAEIEAKAQESQIRLKLEGDLQNKLAVQDDAQAHDAAKGAAQAAHDLQTKAMDQEHQAQMAERSHEQSMETADIGHEHAMEMQASKPEPKKAQKPSAQ